MDKPLLNDPIYRIWPLAVLWLALSPSNTLAQSPSPPTTPSGSIGVVAVESSDLARYVDTVWVEGVAFWVEASEQFTAAMSLTLGDYYEGNFFITNKSSEPFTFDPASIRATALKKSHNGEVKEVVLYTYPADEYLSDVQSHAQFRKAMLALGYGLQSAGAHMSTASRPGDQAVAGSIQRLNDIAAREEAAGAAERIDREVTVETDGLMRKHTIFPGQTYGGRVMFGHAKGESYEFTTKLGAKWFVFRFSSGK